MKMGKMQKQEWIYDYIKRNEYIDIFNAEFVDSYIKVCAPNTVYYQPYGAHTVPEIGRYLSEMYKNNLLERFRVPLAYQYSGFPTWCYVYHIKRKKV